MSLTLEVESWTSGSAIKGVAAIGPTHWDVVVGSRVGVFALRRRGCETLIQSAADLIEV